MAGSLGGIPPEAELKVLRSLWEKGSQTMRELTEAVYPGGGASEYATIQKLLERLLDKGLVIKDSEKWPYVFRAAFSDQEVAARVAAAAAAHIMGYGAIGAVAGLLAGPMGFATAVGGMATSWMKANPAASQEVPTGSTVESRTPKPKNRKRKGRDENSDGAL